MSISSDIQKLNAGSIIELFEIDLTSLGDGILRFHPGKNELVSNITWQGNEYAAFPIQAEGFELSGSGRMPRPAVRVANVTGLVSAALRDFNDLVGAKVTRKRTLVKYLDAVNFPPKRNLLIHTEQFDNAAWTKTRTTITVNVVDSPDESITADKLCNNGIIDSQGYTQTSVTWLGSTIYCASIHVKAADITTCELCFIDSGGFTTSGRVSVDLITGVVSGTGAVNAKATALPGGWWRLSIFATPLVGAGNIRLQLPPDATTGNAGIYIWGAQLELGSVATEYQSIGSVFNGNPSADPSQEFSDEVWFIDRKSAETKSMVEFELTAAWDVQGIALPRRQVVANSCPWKYRSAECSYAGDPVADITDAPTTVLANDVCGKRLSSCKLRFGEFNVLPFGGFPAVALIR